LQEHIREHDQKSCAQIAKMQELTDQLSQELQLARKQLANLMDDNRTVTAKRDSELREYQIKIEKLVCCRVTIDYRL
jgi:predicted RNase H-like nuclease